MLSNKKWLVVVALLAAFALVLGACAPATTAAPSEEAPAETEVAPVASEEAPAGGGEMSGEPYNVGLLSDLTTTNYWAFLDTESSVWQSFVMTYWYPTLMGLADQRFDWVPALSDGMPGERTPEGADQCSVTAKLKSGLTWSDGEPITANDIAFTANTVRTLKLGGNWPSIYGSSSGLADVQAVDDLTVKYIFGATCENVGLLQWEYGASQGPILPEHFWAAHVEAAAPGVLALTEPVAPAADAPQEEQDKYAADSEAYAVALGEAQAVLYGVQVDKDTPVGGAFTFSQWQEGAFAQNDARADYYFSGVEITEYADGGYSESKPGTYEFTTGEMTGDTLLQYKTGPYVPAVIYNVYGDQNAAVLALENGDIDYIFNPISYAAGLKTQIATMDGIATETNPSNGWRYLSFNMTKGAPMKDKAFRQAIAILIDREFIANTILAGQVLPAFSPVPAANAGWYNADAPKLGYKEDGTPMTRKERIEAAVAVLTEGGYTFEGGVAPAVTGEGARNEQVTTGGTLLMPDGTAVSELVLLAPTAGYDPTRSTTAVWVESWLNEFGIPTKAKLTAFNTILDIVFTPGDTSWDMYILGYGLTVFPSYLYDFYNTAGGSNNAGYSTPEMDELTDAFSKAANLEDAKRLAFEIQALAAEDPSIIQIFTNPILDVHRTTVTWPYVEVMDGITGNIMNGFLGSVQVQTSQ